MDTEFTEHEELDNQNSLKELPEQADTQQTTSDTVLDGATKQGKEAQQEEEERVTGLIAAAESETGDKAINEPGLSEQEKTISVASDQANEGAQVDPVATPPAS